MKSYLKDSSSTLFDIHLKLAEVFQFTSRLGETEDKIPAARRIRDRIHSSLPGQLNLEILSKEFNRSKAWLIGEFRKAYVMTLSECRKRIQNNAGRTTRT